MRAYLELLRPANVVTALADVLAGYAIAGLGAPRALPWLLGATACLYAGGVVLNDVFDRHTDAIERPERPIPSGRAGWPAAAALGAMLLAAGVALARAATPDAFAVATALAASILFYDAWSKRHAFLGPLTMGACRGLNLTLGMAAVAGAAAASWPLALVAVTYISAVTGVSRGEVTGSTRRVATLAFALLAGVLIILIVVASGRPATAGIPAILLAGILGWRLLPAFWRATRQPEPAVLRQAVRTGVLSLPILDAVLSTAYAGMLYGGIVLAVAGSAGWLARRFAVT